MNEASTKPTPEAQVDPNVTQPTAVPSNSVPANSDELVHQTLAFYDDAVDSADMDEVEAFERLEGSSPAPDAGQTMPVNPASLLPAAPAAPLQDDSPNVTQPIQAVPASQPGILPPSPPAPLGVNSAVAPAPPQRDAQEDEASIEDYMAKLLQRVNGGGLAAGVSSHASPVSKGAEPPPPIAQVVEKLDSAAPREVKPPPESREGLSNMRELANMSARQAIDSHASRKLSSPLRGKVLVAVSAMAASIGLSLTSTTVFSTRFAVAGAALMVAVIFCRQFYSLSRQIIARSKQVGVS